MMDNKLTLTVKETSILLGVSLPVAYQLTRRADFPTIRIGRKVLISRAGLEQWIIKQSGE